MIETKPALKQVFELHLSPKERLAADLGESIAEKIAELEPELPIHALPQREKMVPDDWITNYRDRRFISRTFRSLARFSRHQASIKEIYEDKPFKPYLFYVPALQTIEDAMLFDFDKHRFVIRGLGPITLQFVKRTFRQIEPEQSLISNPGV